MALNKAQLVNISKENQEPVEVLFNPTEYGIESGVQYAELAPPGLKTPILQFLRGQASTLTLDLFLDRTNTRTSVDFDLRRLRQFVEIDSELHAPPVCLFQWAYTQFQGVVTSFRETYQLFAEDGSVLRARVAMSFKLYEPPVVQLHETPRNSPDRTRVRTMRDNETLAQIAWEAYGDPRLWRRIAEANGIDRPRFVPAGTTLRLPAR